MYRSLGFALLLVSLSSMVARAQIPVTDTGNAAINTITSIQSTISAIEDVIQTGYMLLEITPLDDIAIAADFAETMGLLGELVAEGQALMGDVTQAQAQIEALFDPTVAPDNPLDLTRRVAAMQQQVFAARSYAFRVQTLISTINSAVGHIIRIVALVGGLAGNLQGQQVTNQLLATANQTLGTQAAQAAAQQRVDVMDRMMHTIIVVSLNNIEASRWASWPRQ
jgi:conjugal transfer/entry exclusion protein